MRITLTNKNLKIRMPVIKIGFSLYLKTLLFLLHLKHITSTIRSNEAYQYEAYMLGPVCQPSQDFRYPETQEEIVSIVKEAINKGLTVKAIGARHSMTDILCTDGIPMDMKHFQTKISNTSDNSATFGAGVTLHDVGVFLKENGRALRTAPVFGNITVGGAIGTGAHGSSIKYPSSISEQIISMTIVDGRGEIQKITDEGSLKSFRVHLGLLGIVLDVTFRTVPFYKIRAHNYEISDEILYNGEAERFVRETDQIVMFWYPGLEKVIVVNWTNIDEGTPGDAHSNQVAYSTKEDSIQYVNLLEGQQILPPAQSAAQVNQSQSERYHEILDDGFPRNLPFYTEDGKTMKNPAIGDWNRIVSSICPGDGAVQCDFLHDKGSGQRTIIDNEIALPLESLAQMATLLQDISKKTPCAMLGVGIILRFSGKSEIYMSTSQGRDTVHVEFYAAKRRNEYEDAMAWLPAYQTFLQSMTMDLNGRSHWAKTGFYYHTREMIDKKLDPSSKSSFIAEMLKYDPDGVFLNNFGKRLLHTGTKQDMDPRTTHCALQDNCICQTDKDCAVSQTCGTLLDGYNYNVCYYSQNTSGYYYSKLATLIIVIMTQGFHYYFTYIC